MRMNDEEYFRSCVAKERRLAQLLGHEVEEYYESAGKLWDRNKALPQWTRDWQACGPLIAEYGLTISYVREAGHPHEECVVVGPVGPVVEHYRAHPARDRALMCAIVKAVITILEHDPVHRQMAEHARHGHHAHPGTT